jgi:hypothetical protein
VQHGCSRVVVWPDGGVGRRTVEFVDLPARGHGTVRRSGGIMTNRVGPVGYVAGWGLKVKLGVSR